VVIEGNNDYINACWLPDLIGNEKKFIVSQGPLTETVEDFWRMIIQYDIKVIVMLANLVEEGREKCALYWPLDQNNSPVLQDIELKILAISREECVIKRILEVTYGDLKREVIQIQYTEWPDHGIPSAPDSFLQLIRFVNESRKDDSPILVHCSAGIGRTGTFCLVNVLVEYIEKYLAENNTLPEISLFATILKFRQYRMGMVQTTEQLKFCYEVLYKEVYDIRKEIRRKEKPSRDTTNIPDDPVSYFANKF